MTNTLIDGQEDLAATADPESAPTTTDAEKPETAELSAAAERSDDTMSPPTEPDASHPSIEAPAKESRGSRRKPGSKAASQRLPECQMVELELHDIYDEHPLVDELREEAKVTPEELSAKKAVPGESPAKKVALRELPVQTITKAGLITLAEHSPLHVTLENNKYYCIGGLKFFRLFKHDLPAGTRLHVIRQDGLSDKQLKTQIYFDLFAMPVFCGLNMNDRKVLSALLRTKRGMELFNQAFGSDDTKQLAKILGCDSRTLKKGEIETPIS